MKARLDIGRPSGAALNAALEGLVRLNGVWLDEHPLTPSLGASGARYQRLDPGEEWRTIPAVLKAGGGDCEDLAAYLAAWCRARGVPAHAVARKSGPRRWHAVVRLPDGTIVDPSRSLGMVKRRKRSHVGAEAPTMSQSSIRWRLVRDPQGWHGELTLPGGFTAAGKDADKQRALRKAAAVADAALSNPALQQLLPPQASAALETAKAVIRSPEARAAFKAAKSIAGKAGKGIKKLIKSLW